MKIITKNYIEITYLIYHPTFSQMIILMFKVKSVLLMKTKI
jgi:hypothetical protein